MMFVYSPPQWCMYLLICESYNLFIYINLSNIIFLLRNGSNCLKTRKKFIRISTIPFKRVLCWKIKSIMPSRNYFKKGSTVLLRKEKSLWTISKPTSILITLRKKFRNFKTYHLKQILRLIVNLSKKLCLKYEKEDEILSTSSIMQNYLWYFLV